MTNKSRTIKNFREAAPKMASQTAINKIGSCFTLNRIGGKTHRSKLLSLLLTTTLLLFFSASPAKANCPAGWESWNPPPHHPLYEVFRTVQYGDCVFEYDVCRRPTGKSFLGYEYYISEIRLLTPECGMSNTDIIVNYEEIFYLCIRQFAIYLYYQSGQDLAINCDDWIYPNNIIIVGHPSCVSEPYYDYAFDFNGKVGHIKKVISCDMLGNPQICFSHYKYCYEVLEDDRWRYSLEKVYDGAEMFQCAETIEIRRPIPPDVDGEPSTMVLNCHGVCNSGNPFYYAYSSIATSSIANTRVSPNPTNSEATLSFEVLTSGNLNVTLVDILGQELLEISNEYVETGAFNKRFTTAHLPVGVYFVKISLNGKIKMEQVIKK